MKPSKIPVVHQNRDSIILTFSTSKLIKVIEIPIKLMHLCFNSNTGNLENFCCLHLLSSRVLFHWIRLPIVHLPWYKGAKNCSYRKWKVREIFYSLIDHSQNNLPISFWISQEQYSSLKIPIQFYPIILLSFSLLLLHNRLRGKITHRI